MHSDKHKPESIESLLVEQREAEIAGVFRDTPRDSSWLAGDAISASGARSPSPAILRLWPAAAAAVVLAVSVGGWMFSAELGALKQQSLLATRSSASAFTGCLNGPVGDQVAGDCTAQDRDSDGDIDLADFRSFQLAYSVGR